MEMVIRSPSISICLLGLADSLDLYSSTHSESGIDNFDRFSKTGQIDDDCVSVGCGD